MSIPDSAGSDRDAAQRHEAEAQRLAAEQLAAEAKQRAADAKRLEAEARALLPDGRRDEAIALIERARRLDPARRSATVLHAELLLATQRHAAALEAIEPLCAADAALADAALQSAASAGTTNTPDTAAPTAAPAPAPAPAAAAAAPTFAQRALALRLRSAARHGCADVIRALHDALAAMALVPDNADFAIHAAGLALHVGDAVRARACIRAVLDRQPEHPLAWRFLSDIEYYDGDTFKAIAAADRAVQFAPANLEFREHHNALLQLPSDLPPDAAVDPKAAAGHATATAIASASAAGLPAAAAPLDGAELVRRAPRRHKLAPRESMRDAFRLQGRVIKALILREMQTEYGDSRLGYIWALIEPVIHIVVLGLVFTMLNHYHPPLGDNLYLFYLTGLMPYLVFSHTANSVMNGLRANSALLNLPILKPVDVLLARALVCLGTEMSVMVVVLAGFGLLGAHAMPRDVGGVISAMLLIWLFATGFGVISAMIMTTFEAWATIYGNTQRLLYFASGIFYMAVHMPAWIRDILMWNPLLQGVEWFRSAFFTEYDPHWLMPNYLIGISIATLVVGFAAERAFRHRVFLTT